MLVVLLVVAVFLPISQCQSEVCCEVSGDCFTDDPPFDTANWPLPQCFTPIYMLYRDDLEEPVEITRGNTPEEFVPEDATVYLVHGWLDWYPGWYERAAEQFALNETPYNVISVDWELYENYTQSTSNTRVLGSELADMNEQLNPAYSWCVGHSLGAHSCGHAGKFGANWDRITAMDPTGLNYDSPGCAAQGDVCRLAPGDAPQVDVIHTDAAGAISGGTYSILGHMDFFPNGGVAIQPNCDNGTLTELCSHNQAVEFFMASINNDCFTVNQNCTDQFDLPTSCSECDVTGCPNMGAGADGGSGIFYLETVEEYPFCADLKDENLTY